MMKTYAIHLQKGGVGKTTITGTLAHELKKYGRVIVLDIDPQGNLSSWLLPDPPEWELASVLQGKIEIKDAITKTKEGISIVPTFGLDGELKLYGENQLSNEPFIFCDLIETLGNLKFDYCLLDLSPGIGRLERAALMSVSEAITPMTPEHFSVDGIAIFTDELDKIRKGFKREIIHRRVIINAYDKRIEQHDKILRSMEKNLKDYAKYIIPVDPVFRKAQAINKSPQSMTGADKMKSETKKTIQTIGEALK